MYNYKRGVSVIIIHYGKVLMGKRIGSHGSGTWSFPGGHIDDGENSKSSAVREVYEETGIVITTDSLKYVTYTIDVFSDTKKYITEYLSVNLEDYQEPQLKEPNKCEGWHWVNGKMPRPLFLCNENLLKKANVSFAKELLQDFFPDEIGMVDNVKKGK